MVAEIALVDYFIMGEAVGIVATLFVPFYYSRKQMKELSVDIESKILNDLDSKMHDIAEMAMARSELAEILDKNASKRGSKVMFVMNVLYVYAYAFHMRQRKALKDNEWNGWLRSMRTAFKEGTIGEYWKNVEPKNWFDPAFRDFIENDIIWQSKQSMVTA